MYFLKRNFLSVETILIAYTHTNTHTGTHTEEHTDCIKLNLHTT